MTKSYIKSVSLTREQDEFLEENKKNVSLSAITQSKLNELMLIGKRNCNDCELVKKLNRQAGNLQDMLLKANEFIEERGLWAHFCVWEKEK